MNSTDNNLVEFTPEQIKAIRYVIGIDNNITMSDIDGWSRAEKFAFYQILCQFDFSNEKNPRGIR